MKKIGFLSFGHWSASSHSATRSASDVLLQSIDLAMELCLNLGDGVGQGQAAAFSWPASTPSVNLTPVITFGN
jgi:hypothetical protein